jgi:hypothetical protein
MLLPALAGSAGSDVVSVVFRRVVGGSFVGIELERASCRRGVTSLALSVARWVHIPVMTTFPEAPR